MAGDTARLHQVVANLLANARTHTPAGTTDGERCAGGIRCRPSRARRRARNRPEASGGAVRALLARGHLACPPDRRFRPRAVDRASNRRGARRHDLDAERPGRYRVRGAPSGEAAGPRGLTPRRGAPTSAPRTGRRAPAELSRTAASGHQIERFVTARRLRHPVVERAPARRNDSPKRAQYPANASVVRDRACASAGASSAISFGGPETYA